MITILRANNTTALTNDSYDDRRVRVATQRRQHKEARHTCKDKREPPGVIIRTYFIFRFIFTHE